jgi:hypothetical protein
LKLNSIKNPARFSLSRTFLGLVILLGGVTNPGAALDFGLVIGQTPEISNEIGDIDVSYTPVLTPWFSAVRDDTLKFYLSAKFTMEYRGEAWKEPPVIPELGRSEITWHPVPVIFAALGRRHYQDPSGFISSGLFDGLSGSLSFRGSRFSAGVWYTGLLYKDTADIVMTARDREYYDKPLSPDLGEPETYFASRRVLTSLDWEYPGISSRSSLFLGLLAQFDVNRQTEWLHTQYFSARYEYTPLDGLLLEAAGAAGLGETSGLDPRMSFALSLGGGWSLPTSWEDQLSLKGVYSSPDLNESLGPLLPVNSISRGRVFTPVLSGLAFMRAAYTLRPLAVLSAEAEFSYFMRTDTTVFKDPLASLKGDAYLLGGEVYASILWGPLPDLALTLGAGAFFPQLGNTYAPETEIRWKAALGLILSL